jgi:hypothetical protein
MTACGDVPSADRPYGRDDPSSDCAEIYSAVQIRTDDGHVVGVMYVDRRGLEVGQRVGAGRTSLGRAQDLALAYPVEGDKRIINHVHLDAQKGDRFITGQPRRNLDLTPLLHEWRSRGF